MKNWHFLSSFPKEDRVTLQKERLSYLQLNALMPGYFITVAGLQLTQTIFFAQFIIEQKKVSDGINIAFKKVYSQFVSA